MAYLVQDDKQQQNQQQGAAGASAQVAQAAGGGGGFVGTGSPSTAGIGAGGTGGWTNIQAYLNANAGNTKSADYLKSEVGSQFDKEKQSLDKASTESKAQGQAQVDANKIGQDQASKLIEQAGSQYQYGGQPQTQSYQDIVSGVKNKLNAQYSGPSSFQYGLQDPTQNYGSGLQDQQSFKGLMNSLYQGAAGGRIGKGGLSLQQQLDTGNEALDRARQELLSRYTGLTGDVNSTVSQTQKALDDYAKAFVDNQNADRSNIEGLRSGYFGNVQKAKTDYNTAEASAAASAQAYRDALLNPFKGYSSNPMSPEVLAGLMYGFRPSDYYTAGQSADLSSVSGVDTERNRFNAITDMLGLGDYINRTADATHSKYDPNKAYADLVKKGMEQNNPDYAEKKRNIVKQYSGRDLLA